VERHVNLIGVDADDDYHHVLARKKREKSET